MSEKLWDYNNLSWILFSGSDESSMKLEILMGCIFGKILIFQQAVSEIRSSAWEVKTSSQIRQDTNNSHRHPNYCEAKPYPLLTHLCRQETPSPDLLLQDSSPSPLKQDERQLRSPSLSCSSSNGNSDSPSLSCSTHRHLAPDHRRRRRTTATKQSPNETLEAEAEPKRRIFGFIKHQPHPLFLEDLVASIEDQPHPRFLHGFKARRAGNVPHVMILDPNLSQTKGRKRDGKGKEVVASGRLKSGLELSTNKRKRKCNCCGKMTRHDKRNCPENPNAKKKYNETCSDVTMRPFLNELLISLGYHVFECVAHQLGRPFLNVLLIRKQTGKSVYCQ
ncbi:hypothetical protein Dimus_019931 [Dionaea muscipula]